MEFPDLLRLIDERSTAFRAAVAAAASLDVRVTTCPEWTLFDLVRHLGEGRRSWAATIAAGPAAAAKSVLEGAPEAAGVSSAARPVSWSSSCTTASRRTPCRSTEPRA
ncbi:maleylpyruvate isomerase N-terminal domain-containing protein [Streptomyces sp. NBC_00424]|uniref:maleylpyruvate isomerase N-terminal domain-containing protein n=1 Tax=Streptomyces sp. NBC_00424 TaxID=2903648 RepID=UPI002B1D6E9C|nr:maleylpyruvate isomerase N-terminal domain-containing protein [Streptomyces sp. NBC_00424]